MRGIAATQERDLSLRPALHRRLSAKGIDLAPMLVELVLWSARHEATDAPAPVLRAMRRERDAFIAAVRQRWRTGR